MTAHYALQWCAWDLLASECTATLSPHPGRHATTLTCPLLHYVDGPAAKRPAVSIALAYTTCVTAKGVAEQFSWHTHLI
jgi:hypothetical protein